MKKQKLAILMAALMAASLAGCSGGAKEGAAAAETTAEAKAEESSEAEAPEDEENYDTGDASMDNARNQNDIGEQELLVASFGTSFNDSRRLTIGAIEQAMEDAMPDYSVRRGFTSQIIIDHVKSRDKVAIDNIGEALDRAVDNEIRLVFHNGCSPV